MAPSQPVERHHKGRMSLVRSTLKLTMLCSLTLGIAACSKKKIEDLPAPPAAAIPSPVPSAAPLPQTDLVPGSRADFLAQSGSDTVYFETDMYDIDAEDHRTLRRQAQWLAKFPEVRVTIEGHCDERGTREYNLALGERRANAAKNALANLGVQASRISVISYGKERPVSSGSDEESWTRNRRAVTVVPE